MPTTPSPAIAAPREGVEPVRARGRRPVAALLATLLASTTVLLTGCNSSGSSSKPQDNLPAADSVVQQLAKALAAGNVSSVPSTTSGTAAQTDLTAIMAGMDGLEPQVTPGTITYDGSSASAVLHQTYLLGSKKLTFDSTAHLQHADSGWQVQWAPSIVEPDLTSQTRLRHTRVLPTRASIIGARNVALVEPRPVYHVGVDKQEAGSNSAKVAAQLATVLKIDVATYQKKVAAAGAKAFVEAITLRADQLSAKIQAIPDIRWISDTASLASSSTFATALLGTMGSPTAAQVKASNGDIQSDDQVGVSGLESRYDAQLRGTAGHTIDIVARTGATPSALASSSASPTTDAASATSSSGSTAASASVVKTLFNTDPVAGKNLTITLDADLQTRAETVLQTQTGIAAMVVLKQSTGAVLAAANSTATNGQAIATTGRVAPGSTMKIADSLALVRQGYTASSKVSCPTSATVNGKKFTNDSWYPSSATGTVTLATAVAQSCNTAFVGLAGKVTGAQQLAAASSLGMGTDYDSGFASFYGSIPTTTDAVVHAANMIGQGQVTASPLAMAGVAASVGAGRTIIPNLVVGNTPKSTATALTAAEAAQLQTIMKTVVSSGTGRSLSGLVTGAKTGTAEYADGSTTKTHAWMICYTGTYAIAVMVYDGTTGAGTAGPLVKAFLQAS